MVSNIPLIDIEQVSYSYPAATGNQVAALHEVSLRIECGEYVALLGHNGSGKSTLARHCNALLLPDSGRVLVAGNDTHNQRLRREVRDRVGMIFQNPDNQIIATVVKDDVAWALAVRGLPAPLIRERVAVLEHGQIAFDGPPATVFADLEQMRRLKLAIPAPIELAARLRAAGIPIDPAALTVEAIASELIRMDSYS